ncbi:hypothetical protein GCM10010922_10550 [Microbacterium sorbitolivorans]|nr:amino acid deaminase [Microbacterium sorbitolivorans]GGF37212.1 hypothetical protein GCM10010922_10550 [Microbacterium sorbitolivorans]
MHTPPAMDTVLACVARDRADGLLERWSASTVIDENVGEAVVERDVFERIHSAGGVNARFPIGNAGLVHVYGYLFSTVVTPYGYKSDRWNDGVLATALGRPAGYFRLGDGDETPLARVLGSAEPLLLDPPASAHVAEWDADGARQRAVVTEGLLVSGLDEGAGMRLLTIFPVADAAAFTRDLSAEAPRLRWNAARAS